MSKQITDGGPAFPRPSYVSANYPHDRHEAAELTNDAQSGMTLRDYFAGQALALGGEFFHNYGNGCDTDKHIAQAAYQIADAMLAERERQQ